MSAAPTSHQKREGARRYIRGTSQERFNAYLQPGECRPGMATACIEWTGFKNRKGYGRFTDGSGRSRRDMLAHRYALELLEGPDPRPVLHSCDNPACCNPEHLRYGSLEENNKEMAQRGRAAHGEAKNFDVLTAQLVIEARRRARDGDTITSIAADLNVSEGTIRHAVRGNTWRHLPGAVAATRAPRSGR